MWQAEWDESLKTLPIGVGDLDGDARADLAIGGAERLEYREEGYTDTFSSVYVVRGGQDGVPSSGLGDIDGDGLSGLFVPQYRDYADQVGSGLGFVFLGSQFSL